MGAGDGTASDDSDLGRLLREAGDNALSARLPDDQLFGGFQLGELIGVGGMGASVYHATSTTEPDTIAAVKILPEAFALDSGLARRFKREAKVMRKIQHPNIVRMLAFGAAENHFIVMEYLDGGSLAERLATEGTLEADEAVRITLDVGAGLAELHRQRITHRDVKPGNILIATDGRAKLADFGLAKFLDPTSVGGPLTRSGDQLGTNAYMAPEQLAKASSGDHASDLYSLGVVLYQMLTGVVPRGRVDAPSASRPELARYDEVVMRAIAAEPTQRFPDVDAFRQSLKAAHERPRRRFSRRTMIAGLAGLTGVSTLIAWPFRKRTHLAWKDIAAAQESLGSSEPVNIGLPRSESRLRFRLLLNAAIPSYAVEPIDVPNRFSESLSISTLQELPAPLAVLARLALRSVTVALPPSVRISSVKRLQFANPPVSGEGDQSAFAKACQLVDQIESASLLRRNNDNLTLDHETCSDYGSFCAALGIVASPVSELLSKDTQSAALLRVGAYQLLRHPDGAIHPALANDSDFQIESIETRSPLELIADLIAGPWLLRRLPLLAKQARWRPLYDGQLGTRSPQNQPAVSAVEHLLETLS